jgi:hypothetical protein
MYMYLELKRKHQKETNNFPVSFAFNNQQFEEGMRKLGLELTEKDKVVGIGGGGFIRKSDSDALWEMMNRHDKEMSEAKETSDQFVFEMFDYELGNHEYTYTGTVSDTLAALGLTLDEVKKSPRLLKGLEAAKKAQWVTVAANA